jgi:hypothetical protein
MRIEFLFFKNKNHVTHYQLCEKISFPQNDHLKIYLADITCVNVCFIICILSVKSLLQFHYTGFM